MSRVSQRSQARYGTPIRTAVEHEVFAALLAESKRTARSVGHVSSLVLGSWREVLAVKPEVLAALEAEAARCKMSVPKLVAALLGYWYEDDYLWSQKQTKGET